MSQRNETIYADMAGRVMSLEQRVKGLQGRISAIEVRLSGPAGIIPAEACIPEDTEFVPAGRLFSGQEGPDALGARVSAIEGVLDGGRRQESHIAASARAFDTTGLITGAILIGTGLLLYAGNVDIIKNPLLPMGCGILLIAGATLRVVL